MARRKANKPRRLTEEDYVGFFEATERRTGPMTRDQIIEAIRQKNPYRWWRIQYDYRWLKKQVKKLGLNPDDARELL